MRTYRSILGSIGGGVVITLITGFINSTPGGLVGARWYGLPLAWITKRVLAPQYNPWHLNIVGLVVDIVVWMLIIEIIYLAARTLEKSGKSKPQAKGRRRR